MNKEKKECLQKLQEIEQDLRALLDKVGRWNDEYETPVLVEKVLQMKKEGKVKNITASWLQRKFKIGYNKASKLLGAIHQYEEENGEIDEKKGDNKE